MHLRMHITNMCLYIFVEQNFVRKIQTSTSTRIDKSALTFEQTPCLFTALEDVPFKHITFF